MHGIEIFLNFCSQKYYYVDAKKSEDSMRVSIETEIPGKVGIPEARLSNFFNKNSII